MSLSGLEGTRILSLSLEAKGTSQIQSAWGGSGGQGEHGIKLTVNGSLQRLQEGAGEEKARHPCWVVTPQMEPSSVCLPAPPQMETRADRREERPVPLLPSLALEELGFSLPKSKRIFPPAQVPARRGNAFPAQSSATALACPCAHGAQAKGSLAEPVGLARVVTRTTTRGPRAPGSEPGSAGAHNPVTKCHQGRQV